MLFRKHTIRTIKITPNIAIYKIANSILIKLPFQSTTPLLAPFRGFSPPFRRLKGPTRRRRPLPLHCPLHPHLYKYLIINIMFNTIQGKNLSFPQNALYSAIYQRFTPSSRKKVDGLWAFCVPAKARRKKKMPYSLIFLSPSRGCSQRGCGRCRNLVICYNRTCYEQFSVFHCVCGRWSSGPRAVATTSIGEVGRSMDAYAFHARAYIYKETLRVPAGRLAAGPRRAPQKGSSMPISNVGDALPELAADVAVLSKRAYNVVGYSLPRLHNGEKWYVDFYQMDRGRGCMRRKKYYINMAMAVRERTKYARELIARLSTLLR